MRPSPSAASLLALRLLAGVFWSCRPSNVAPHGSPHVLEPKPVAPPAAASARTGARLVQLASLRTATCALLPAGTIRCFGEGARGELGDGRGEASARPVLVKGIGRATAIAGGDGNACAIDEGEVKCWGYNIAEDPVNVAQTPRSVGVTHATGVAIGSFSGCALVEGGDVLCWFNPGHRVAGTFDSAPRVVLRGSRSPYVLLRGNHDFYCAANGEADVQCFSLETAKKPPAPKHLFAAADADADAHSSNITDMATDGERVCLVAHGKMVCKNRDGSAVSGIDGEGARALTALAVEPREQYARSQEAPGLCAIDAEQRVVCKRNGTARRLDFAHVTSVSVGLATCVVVASGVRCFGKSGQGRVGAAARDRDFTDAAPCAVDLEPRPPEPDALSRLAALEGHVTSISTTDGARHFCIGVSDAQGSPGPASECFRFDPAARTFRSASAPALASLERTSLGVTVSVGTRSAEIGLTLQENDELLGSDDGALVFVARPRSDINPQPATVDVFDVATKARLRRIDVRPHLQTSVMLLGHALAVRGIDEMGETPTAHFELHAPRGKRVLRVDMPSGTAPDKAPAFSVDGRTAIYRDAQDNLVLFDSEAITVRNLDIKGSGDGETAQPEGGALVDGGKTLLLLDRRGMHAFDIGASRAKKLYDAPLPVASPNACEASAGIP